MKLLNNNCQGSILNVNRTNKLESITYLVSDDPVYYKYLINYTILS